MSLYTLCRWVREARLIHRAKKSLKTMRNEFRLYEDLLPEETRRALEERLVDVRQAIRCRETEDLPALLTSVQGELTEALPRSRWGWASEWFDILVSSLAVAFCIRAYYYEPFQIPTGSMQPTLYGIHVEEAPGPTAWDRQPARFFKWLVTGERYVEVVAPTGGVVASVRPSAKPGFTTLLLNGAVPLDVPDAAMDRVHQKLAATQGRVFLGQCLWRGYVRSGDFLFVNRWLWNLRHPRLGETIVFATQGIPGLPQNQHYIKRLCGRPGDEVELKADDAHLWINGQAQHTPLRLEEIAEHCMPWPGAPRYLGYRPAQPSVGFPAPQARFSLKRGEYLALGDNSGNSLDSRYWGTVPAKNLLGPAAFVHWPFTSPRWGRIR